MSGRLHEQGINNHLNAHETNYTFLRHYRYQTGPHALTRFVTLGRGVISPATVSGI